MPVTAHPPMWYSGHAEQKRVIGNVANHYRAGTDKRIATNRNPTDDCGIRPDGSTAAYQGALVLVSAYDLGSRIIDVREYTRRTTEYIVLQLDTGVQGDVVLDLYVISD